MREITYLQAITEAVDEEMARDPTVFLMGEDIRQWGAPFGEFKGLFEKYGGSNGDETNRTHNVQRVFGGVHV